MFTFIKVALLKITLLTTGYTDSLKIEQMAFNEFISRVDSIVLMNYPERRFFHKDSNRIYFSGETELYSAMPFALNKMCRKPDFISTNTPQDHSSDSDPWIYPEKGNKTISFSETFLIKSASSNEVVHKGGLRLFMSNRYFRNGFYYIKFLIVQDIFNVTWYYKLDVKGKLIDYVLTTSVN